MKKYSRELINRYINSEDITIYDIDELENDKDFMMQVISVSGDNNFYNLCSDNVKCDYEFAKYLIIKFKHKIDFVCEVADYFLSHVGKELETTEIYTIMFEITKGNKSLNKKYFLVPLAKYDKEKLIVELYKKSEEDKKILEYFSSATQIGMTATPKETKYVSNINYFGEPLYQYSLKEGIEDGFLAPFRVIDVKTNIGEGWRPFKDQRDKNGDLIEDRIYTNKDFDYNIIIEDRTYEVAQEITNYLKSTDRMQKTIVFCANEDHAERMRIALSNLNSDLVKENSDYVVRITGSDDYGKSKLDYFISVSSKYPVIATTSKLLSTGADCKMTKLIVLDENISSMTEFKQIIGRGTRLRVNEGKTHFAIMDFRNVTRLFADPDWDGEVEIDEGFTPGQRGPSGGTGGGTSGGDTVKPIIDPSGCKVEITGKTVSVYDTNGKLLKQENIIDYTKTNILEEYASLDKFIRKWSTEEKKETIKILLAEHGIDLEQIKESQNMSDVDDFDFICHIAFNKKPLTRKERANNVKKRDFFSKYSGVAREVLEALLDRYMNVGIYEVEKATVLKLDPFVKYGKPAKIAQYFGGKEGYIAAIRELEEELYKVG